jgi:hypothetical protein
LELLASLRHSRIVKLLAYSLRDGKGYLVLEYMSHKSLDSWLYPRVSFLHDEPDGSDRLLSLKTSFARTMHRMNNELRDNERFEGYGYVKVEAPASVQRPEGRRVHLQGQRPALPCAVLTVGTEVRVISLQRDTGTVLTNEEIMTEVAAALRGTVR